MQYPLLDILKCPLTKTSLRFELITEFDKAYGGTTIKEVKDGLLYSETGFVFPIINGIPRLLIESLYDYAGFLQQHLPHYQSLKNDLEKNYKGVLDHCVSKNKKTKQSFELEWSFLDPKEKEQVWRDDSSSMPQIFLKETGESESFYTGKTVIDVGCGHGIMTGKIAAMASLAVGVELSKAVENAYSKNQNSKAWYLQADLQFLPFDDATFDVLYSSGVIHHTNNTELSLSLIEPVLKPGGKLCLWLYHPQNNRIHNMILGVRGITSKLPLRLAFVLLMIFVFPFTFLLKKIKNKKKLSYREEIIDLLDQFTPQFRYEIPHDQALLWLKRRKYAATGITTENQFGFSVVGTKS